MAAEDSIQQPDTAAAVEQQRGRSTIDFPYLDLDNAIDIVKAIHKVEGDRCDWSQLATSLGVAPEGGGFRQRMLTAKTFGLLTYEKGQVMLTDCGIRASDPNFEKRARYEAFMNVPLFSQLFDRFKGQQLPPIAGMERAIENCGVAPKQKDKVRQVFQRSAKQAGFFELSSDRLSIPPGLNGQKKDAEPPKEVSEPIEKPQNTTSGSSSVALHPFVQGLIQKLPKSEGEWDLISRAKWLTTAANIFDLMYTGGSDQGITVKLDGNTLSVSVGGRT
jgi:hypothetical protein